MRPVKQWERQDFTHWTWIADSDVDVFGNAATYPLGVPLCCGCDNPIKDDRCDWCQIELVREQLTEVQGDPFGNPFLNRKAAA